MNKTYLWILLILIPLTLICFRTVTSPLLTVEDAGNHLSFSIDFTYSLERIWSSPDVNMLEKLGETRRLMYTELPHQAGFVPHLTYLNTSLYYTLFGRSAESAVKSNFTYLLILILFVWLTAKNLTDKENAYFAVLILLLTPVTGEYMRQYGADLPLAAATIVVFYLLIKSQNFASLKYSVLAGLSLGISANFKFQIFIFTAVPVLVALIQGFREAGVNKKKTCMNFMFFILCFSFILLLLGYRQYGRFITAFNMTLPIRQYQHDREVVSGMLRYARIGLDYIPLVVIYILSMRNILYSKNRHKILIFSFILLPAIFAILRIPNIQYKDTTDVFRHILPLFPVAAAAASAYNFKNFRLLKAITVSLAFLVFFRNMGVSTELNKKIASFETVIDDVLSNVGASAEQVNIIHYSMVDDILNDAFMLRYRFRLRGEEFNAIDLRTNYRTAYDYLRYNRYNKPDCLLLRIKKESSISDLFDKDYFSQYYLSGFHPFTLPLFMEDDITAGDIYKTSRDYVQESRVVFLRETAGSRWYLIINR